MWLVENLKSHMWFTSVARILFLLDSSGLNPLSHPLTKKPSACEELRRSSCSGLILKEKKRKIGKWGSKLCPCRGLPCPPTRKPLRGPTSPHGLCYTDLRKSKPHWLYIRKGRQLPTGEEGEPLKGKGPGKKDFREAWSWEEETLSLHFSVLHPFTSYFMPSFISCNSILARHLHICISLHHSESMRLVWLPHFTAEKTETQRSSVTLTRVEPLAL